MRVDEKFNRRTANLVDAQSPVVDAQYGNALGVRVRIFEAHGGEARHLNMHLTPDEALTFARHLIEAAQRRLEE